MKISVIGNQLQDLSKDLACSNHFVLQLEQPQIVEAKFKEPAVCGLWYSDAPGRAIAWGETIIITMGYAPYNDLRKTLWGFICKNKTFLVLTDDLMEYKAWTDWGKGKEVKELKCLETIEELKNACPTA
jgi:hypothetical protein